MLYYVHPIWTVRNIYLLACSLSTCSLVADTTTVVSDLNDQSYVGEFEPKSGSGADIGQGLIDFAEETKGIELDDLEVLGGDGCAVNTGKSNSVFSFVERKLGRPLQRVICLLHFWEIMLAHFVKLYVGPTLRCKVFTLLAIKTPSPDVED